MTSRFGNVHCETDVWTHIESRQFIGWWRDAVSDAITSSAHTGERAIHSSDFSAFTKRSHYPSLLRFSDPTYLLRSSFGDCLSGTLFFSRWSAMEFRRCQPPCARFIAREDPHSKCIKYLGFSHARDAVYGTSKCKISEDFRLITLRSRLEDCEREASFFPRRASSTSAAPREIAASRESSRWIGPMSPASSELRNSTSGAHSKPERRKLPFFSDLHREISSSWKQPFSSRLTNTAVADFTNLVGSVEQGYTAMPVIEDTLASHLSPSLAPSWKYRPLLPSKPCRTTSALIGKSYIAASQAGMALHTMAILQAYQADVLK